LTGRAIQIVRHRLDGRYVLTIGGFVLVIMMTKVFGCKATFMLTITRRHSPRSLKRKNQQQQNGTPITHLLSVPTVWKLKKLRALL
jgi:hypothetical protein